MRGNDPPAHGKPHPDLALPSRNYFSVCRPLEFKCDAAIVTPETDNVQAADGPGRALTEAGLREARQRLDLSAERLGHALARNREQHRRRFVTAVALLRSKTIANRIANSRDRADGAYRRLARVQGTRLAEIRRGIDALARILMQAGEPFGIVPLRPFH